LDNYVVFVEGFCELENYVVFLLKVFVDWKLYVVFLGGRICGLENYVVFLLKVFVDWKLCVVFLRGFVHWKTM